MAIKPSILVCLLFLLPGSLLAEEINTTIDELTVYTAKTVITMEPSMPEAQAIAVANGRIVSVGTLDSLKPWTDKYNHKIDKTFEDKIILPGFIDPHVHPSLPAILTLFPFIAPESWEIPTGTYPAAPDNESYIRLLKEQAAKHEKSPYYDENIPFITWGFHQLWHGDVYRPTLDELFPNKPIVLWHRSFHELILNSAAIELLGISEEETNTYPQDNNWLKGLYTEYGGKAVLLPKLMPKVLTSERYLAGMEHFVDMMHLGGVTSAMDMGVGIFGDAEGEISLIKKAMQDAPSRIVLTPIITDFLVRNMSPEEALEVVAKWETNSSDKVIFDKHFKLMIDGAAFSGLGQMGFPGYIDGHEGVWMSPLGVTYQYAKTFWNAGYQLHAHTNGDKSAAQLIRFVRRLQAQKPRVDHRTTLEHFMYAKEDQVQQMADLGMAVSANPYYQYILADMYAKNWLGEDRARKMVPLAAAVRSGMRIGLHSDAPMAPLNPLNLVDAAVNRSTINGNKNNQAESLTVEQALRAVTIDAAWLMRMEDRIGSIRAGKIADFTILESNPLKVDQSEIKNIKVWGTVFEGAKHPWNG